MALATDTASTDTSTADAAVAASVEANTEAPAAATEAAPAGKKTTLTGEPAIESKAEESAEAKPPVVPEKYELKLPENATIDSSAIERTAAIARELGLSNEAAQKSLEFLNTEVAARESAYLESTKPGGAEWTRRVTEFEEMALKDTEIGGTPEKLKASAAEAQKILKEYASPEVAQFLHETGFGSHPAVVRFLAKVAKATSDGRIIQPGSQTAHRKSDAEVLYDHPTSQPGYISP